VEPAVAISVTLERLSARRRKSAEQKGEATMRTTILTALCGAALLAAVAGPAHSAPTFFYLRADAGGSFPTGSDLNGFDPSPVFGGGIGFSPLPFLRTDVTATYRSQYSGSGAVSGTPFAANSDIKSFVGMVNAYFDFPTIGRFTPYVGGGGGIAHNELGSTTISTGGATVATIGGASKTDFAWQVGGGVAVNVLPTIALDIAYHYLDAGKFESASFAGGTLSGRLKAHEVTAGIRVGF
jgi:opacity protein-like surface antigen